MSCPNSVALSQLRFNDCITNNKNELRNAEGKFTIQLQVNNKQKLGFDS